MQRGMSWQPAGSSSKTKLLTSSLVRVMALVLLLCKETVLSQTLTVTETIYVPRGFCVHVPCRFTAPDDWYEERIRRLYGYWLKITTRLTYLDDGGTLVTGDLVATNYFYTDFLDSNVKLTGNPERGDCSFSILTADSNNQGWYYFRITKGEKYNHAFLLTKSQIILTGSDLPKPMIKKPLEIVWGKPATFSCVTRNSCSSNRPQILWPVETRDVNITSWSKSESPWVWIDGITATFIPSVADEGRRLTCRVTYPATRRTIENAIALPSGYKPEPNKIPTSMECWHEGPAVFCFCSFLSLPPSKIHWNVDGKNLTEDNAREPFEVTSFSLGNEANSLLKWTKNRGKVKNPFITCSATNPFGYESVQLSLLPKRAFLPLLSPVEIIGIVIGIIILVPGTLTLLYFALQRSSSSAPASQAASTYSASQHTP